MHSRRNFLRAARALSASALFCTVLASARPAASEQPYHILDHWKLADSGWWDYLVVDSPAHRLFITRGDHVDVLDTQTGKLLNTIGHLHGTHGVALDTAGKFGYISDGGGNTVVAFDRNTLAIVATIPAGMNPDGIVFEPATQTVWAFNGRSKSTTVIDTVTQKVVATIPLPGKPEFPVVDGHGTVFDNIEDKSGDRPPRRPRPHPHCRVARRLPVTFRPGLRHPRPPALHSLRRQKDGRGRLRIRQGARYSRHR